MAYQKKVYRGNRPRGGIPGKAVDTGHEATGKTKKNYALQEKSHWGAEVDNAQEYVQKSIRRSFGGG